MMRITQLLKPITREEVIGIIGIVFAAVLFLLGRYIQVPLEWGIIASVLITIGSIITILWSRLTKKIVIRSPFMRVKNKVPKTKDIEIVVPPENSGHVYMKKDLEKLEELVSRAHNEIYFQGITLESLRQITPTISKALRDNKRVRILILDNKFELINRVEKLVASSKVEIAIDRTLDSLGLSDADPPITASQRDSLRIRKHRQIPTHTLIIADPHGNNTTSYMQFEPYLYGIPSGDRWVFLIRKTQQPILFGIFVKAFENLWDTAEKV